MIGNDWDMVLANYFNSSDYIRTIEMVDEEYHSNKCFPPKSKIFAALENTPFSSVRVVILGQDPYHTEGMADGHAFSADVDKLPPSLVNIFHAVKIDYPESVHESGSLVSWARQGVLLLNTSLTVRKGIPMSHKHLGWDKMVSEILRVVLSHGNVVIMMWGKPSEKLVASLPYNDANLYLVAPHPSPLSAYRGYFECRHFVLCNEFLDEDIDFSTRKEND